MANRQNTLLIKRSNVPDKIPPLSGLTLGELALNTSDAKLYSLYTSGSVTPSEVKQIGWDRISRTGDTVYGDYNIFGDVAISGSSLPNGYALAVTGDTDFKSDVYVEGDIYFSGNVITTGSTIIQNGLTANTIYTDYIDFNLTATSVHNEGRLNWNDDTKTLEIDTEVNNFSIELGQENVVRVSNKTGNLLTKGTLVFITGGTNNRPTVTLASRDAERTSARTLGFVGHNIDPDAEGYVVTYGLLRDINTIAYTAGTQLYLFTGGTWTSEKPIAPNHDVRVGVVIRQSLGAGIIFVTVQNGYELDEIHDVRISGLTAGDLLVQSSFNGSPVWINTKTLPGNYTISGNTSHIGNFSITGNTTQSGNTTQLGNFTITGNTTQYGIYTHSGNTFTTGNTAQIGNINLTGDTTQLGIYTHSGNTFITGNTTQIGYITLSGNTSITGNTTQIGNYHITGNTNQEGIYTHSGDTFITGNTTQIGDVTLLGDIFISGDTNQVGNFYLTGDTIIQSGITASTYNISSLPTENNTLFQILGRNETTGQVEYRQVNTIGNNITIITGGTYSAQTTIDNVIGVDTTSSTTTIYLPDSVSSGRLRFEIKDIGLNAYNNPITIIAAGTDTIISYTNSQTLIMESEGGAIILLNTGLGQWWQM